MLDYYQMADALSPEDKQTQTVAREFMEAEAADGVLDWWESGEFPKHLVAKFGEMGFLGREPARRVRRERHRQCRVWTDYV